MKIQRSTTNVHPLLIGCIDKIQKEVIQTHNAPIRLFETWREHDRHASLIKKGKTKDIVSRHLFNVENDPPLYTTAVDYVYYKERWSWNLRDGTVAAWYELFGNLVLDVCHELEWGGMHRKSINYCHFQMRKAVLIDNLDKYPCVTPG